MKCGYHVICMPSPDDTYLVYCENKVEVIATYSSPYSEGNCTSGYCLDHMLEMKNKDAKRKILSARPYQNHELIIEGAPGHCSLCFKRFEVVLEEIFK